MNHSTKFSLVCNTADGSRTYEDYDSVQDALYAYYHVTLLGTHLAQNGNGVPESVPEDATWSLDVELWDLDNNSCTFGDISDYVNYLN